MTLQKFFNFLEDEKQIYVNWEKSDCFKSKKNKDPYSIMMPPPNVTGIFYYVKIFFNISNINIVNFTFIY